MLNTPKLGDLVRIVANTNHHNYCLGGSYVVTVLDSYDQSFQACGSNGVLGNWLTLEDVELDTPTSRASIVTTIQDLEAQHQMTLSTLKERLSILDAMGVEEADDLDIQIFQSLPTLQDPKLSVMDRIRAIRRLVTASRTTTSQQRKIT